MNEEGLGEGGAGSWPRFDWSTVWRCRDRAVWGFIFCVWERWVCSVSLCFVCQLSVLLWCWESLWCLEEELRENRFSFPGPASILLCCPESHPEGGFREHLLLEAGRGEVFLNLILNARSWALGDRGLPSVRKRPLRGGPFSVSRPALPAGSDGRLRWAAWGLSERRGPFRLSAPRSPRLRRLWRAAAAAARRLSGPRWEEGFPRRPLSERLWSPRPHTDVKRVWTKQPCVRSQAQALPALAPVQIPRGLGRRVVTVCTAEKTRRSPPKVLRRASVCFVLQQRAYQRLLLGLKLTWLTAPRPLAVRLCPRTRNHLLPLQKNLRAASGRPACPGRAPWGAGNARCCCEKWPHTQQLKAAQTCYLMLTSQKVSTGPVRLESSGLCSFLGNWDIFSSLQGFQEIRFLKLVGLKIQHLASSSRSCPQSLAPGPLPPDTKPEKAGGTSFTV